MNTFMYSRICTLAMTIALATLMFFGIMLWKIDLLPDWAWIRATAGTACVLAFAAVGVSAVISGVCAASHAERAMAAGNKYRRTMWFAFVFTGGCVAVDVLAGHIGLQILDGGAINMPHTSVTTAALIFVALARPLMAMILQGVEDIEAEKAALAKDKEHQQHIDVVKATKAETEARIGAGAISLDAARKGSLGKAASAVGAAALILGMGVSQSPQASAQTPYVDATTETTQAAQGEDFDARLSVDGVWAKGPRAVNRETFEDAFNVVRENPDISSRQLAEEFGVTPKTAGRWKQWALAILGNEANAELLDEFA